eukprot:scaffold25112_cov50-Phaeocystis_antarctica.AAC.2
MPEEKAGGGGEEGWRGGSAAAAAAAVNAAAAAVAVSVGEAGAGVRKTIRRRRSEASTRCMSQARPTKSSGGCGRPVRPRRGGGGITGGSGGSGGIKAPPISAASGGAGGAAQSTASCGWSLGSKTNLSASSAGMRGEQRTQACAVRVRVRAGVGGRGRLACLRDGEGLCHGLAHGEGHIEAAREGGRGGVAQAQRRADDVRDARVDKVLRGDARVAAVDEDEAHGPRRVAGGDELLEQRQRDKVRRAARVLECERVGVAVAREV